MSGLAFVTDHSLRLLNVEHSLFSTTLNSPAARRYRFSVNLPPFLSLDLPQRMIQSFLPELLVLLWRMVQRFSLLLLWHYYSSLPLSLSAEEDYNIISMAFLPPESPILMVLF